MFRKKSTAEITHPSRQDRETAPVLLLLDDIRSMHNVGSLFRTADAFGIGRLLLCGYTPTPPHRDIRKTALGAEEAVPWTHHPAAEDALRWFREAFPGGVVAALEQAHGSIPLPDIVLAAHQPLLLVLGNEVTGVSDALLEQADHCIEIPQWGTKHSLNVSVAAGVALYALTAPR